MIRTVWAYSFGALATLYYGSIVFVASVLRFPKRIYFWATSNWARALMFGSDCHVRTHGLERVDWSRPHVLVTNHTGSYEILALAVNVPVPYHFVAKKELERVPVFGPAWRRAGHISIDRSDHQKAIDSLRRAGETVRRDGGIVIIFPEGTRSRTGELQPFKRGAFLLAIQAGLPVIPAIVTGSARIHAPGSMRITPGTMDLYFGDPIPVEGYDTSRVDDLVRLVHGTMREMLESASQTAPVQRSTGRAG